jgi:5'-deoxynucleotidase YfbR-like HD superfamily hydrolase
MVKETLAKPARAWQRMLSGRRLDLVNPSPLDIEIEDIAHGLARLARWNGQTKGDHAFSVAQHCLLVEKFCEGTKTKPFAARWRLAALLHDAAEYVIGDLISPFKTAVGFDYKAFELRLEEAIHLRFSLPGQLPENIRTLIKRADRMAAYCEATELAGFTEAEAAKLFTRPRQEKKLRLVPMPPQQAEAAYLERFSLLHKALSLGSAPLSWR